MVDAMPSEDQQRELNQPWKVWASELKPDLLSKEVLPGGSDGDSQHGTVAIKHRPEVDLLSKKPKPIRCVYFHRYSSLIVSLTKSETCESAHESWKPKRGLRNREQWPWLRRI
jgi:hypothetical protein